MSEQLSMSPRKISELLSFYVKIIQLLEYAQIEKDIGKYERIKIL